MWNLVAAECYTSTLAGPSLWSAQSRRLMSDLALRGELTLHEIYTALQSYLLHLSCVSCAQALLSTCILVGESYKGRTCPRTTLSHTWPCVFGSCRMVYQELGPLVAGRKSLG